MYSTIVLHANLQYAEIPVDDVPQVVENSYIPVLKTLLDIPKAEVVLNFTGVTLEILGNENQEVLDLLKEGIDKGKFELTGCGYSHPIFPLLPEEDIEKQIEFNLQVLEKTLNYTPKGFWLPELAYDPTLPRILKKYGFSYIFIDDELYTTSSPLLNDSNQYNFPYYSASHFLIDFMKARGVFQQLSRFRKALKGLKTKENIMDAREGRFVFGFLLLGIAPILATAATTMTMRMSMISMATRMTKPGFT